LRPLADKKDGWYNDPMTYLKFFEKRLGKAGVKRLSPAWKRHIKRMDALPKLTKSMTARQVRELLGV
jgi:hypothetical protein